MKPILPLLLIVGFLAGCSERHDVMEDLPNSSIAGAAREEMSESRIESPLARPVVIGEDGPRLDACGALGEVQGLGEGQALDLRAAPFREAKRTGGLVNGARLFICTRSIDQRWLGIVVAPPQTAPSVAITNATAPSSTDCGVSSPVDGKRPYDGPCQSGWVASSFVRAVGR